MKKYIFSIAMVACQTAVMAQTVNVHFKNGQQVQFNSSNVDYVDFSEKAPDPTVTSGAAVDLGLSVYWASCNLGAEKPEEYGEYYAWGETSPKSSYEVSNYSYYDHDTMQYIDIGDDISGTEYDAATVNLGGDWRMPTRAEFQELKNKCTWEWQQINGINGYLVSGTNGNSIFLPATFVNYYLWYHSSSQYNTNKVYYLDCISIGDIYISYSKGYKYEGYSIRPVTNNPDAAGDPIDHSKDYLVTDKVTASFLGGAYSSINGKIQSGSQLNVKFSNGSSESVTLVKIQLNDAATSSEGNNLLNAEIEVPAGESKSYTITVGSGGITTPVICFTYRYNKKNYTAEATWTTPSI